MQVNLSDVQTSTHPDAAVGDTPSNVPQGVVVLEDLVPTGDVHLLVTQSVVVG